MEAKEKPADCTTQADAPRVLPVTCIVRGHISGDAWELYAAGEREICGVPLPEGLKNGDKLPKPIFTPVAKVPEGDYDRNITFGEMSAIIGNQNVADDVYCSCMSSFANAYDIFLNRGIILTKMEFELGIDNDGKLILGNETPVLG